MFKKAILSFIILLFIATGSYGEYLTITKDATSQIIQIPIFDSTSYVGGMLTGLTFESSGLVCYYNRTGAAGAATQISLVTATKGTWTSSGFVAVDGTNMPGWYELHVPNAVLATGADSVTINCKGATNMVPVPIIIKLADTPATAQAVWEYATRTLSNTIGIKKNTATNNFEVQMVLSSDHVTAATGKTVACQRSIDGGAYANCNTTTATEVSSGTYKINLAASDVNGTWVSLKFSATDCDTRVITIKTND